MFIFLMKRVFLSGKEIASQVSVLKLHASGFEARLLGNPVLCEAADSIWYDQRFTSRARLANIW